MRGYELTKKFTASELDVILPVDHSIYYSITIIKQHLINK